MLKANSSSIETAFNPHIGGICKEQIIHRNPVQVFCVGDGLGVDSMAMLIAMRDWKITPQVITFADVGDMTQNKPGEKPETYDYIPVLRNWLKANNFPDLVIVHKKRVRAPYDTLYENCIVNGTLPSLAFGFKGCSIKWKVVVQEAYMKKLEIVKACWAAGFKIIKAIGYDNGPKDLKRGSKPEDDNYVYWYPLRETGWDRRQCIERIAAEGLPGWNADNEWSDRLEWVEKGGVPLKSACFFCPATHKWEIDRLYRTQPQLLDMAIQMEIGAKNHPVHPLTTTKGLSRNWSWGDYAKEKKFSLPVLESCEVCDAV